MFRVESANNSVDSWKDVASLMPILCDVSDTGIVFIYF